MNYFKAAEQLLSAVPTLERALENLQKRQQRLIDKGAPKEPSIDYSKPFCDSRYVSDTLGELLELSECVGNIAKTKETLAAIKQCTPQAVVLVAGALVHIKVLIITIAIMDIVSRD